MQQHYKGWCDSVWLGDKQTHATRMLNHLHTLFILVLNSWHIAETHAKALHPHHHHTTITQLEVYVHDFDGRTMFVYVSPSHSWNDRDIVFGFEELTTGALCGTIDTHSSGALVLSLSSWVGLFSKPRKCSQVHVNLPFCVIICSLSLGH